MEETPDNIGRWFAIYDADGAETFSARLLNESDELGVAWARNLRELASNLAGIQDAIGRSIPRIVGTASAGLEAAIKAGKFDSDLYERRLGRHLGGKWRVQATRRSNVLNEVWDIIATRETGSS